MVIDLLMAAGIVCMVFGMWGNGLLLIGLAWGAYLVLR